MSEYTTVSGSTFPVEDITHRSSRSQADNLKAAFGEKNTDNDNGVETNIPKILTVERAIRYFEENARGDLEKLYSFTAQILRAYNDRSMPAAESEDDND